MPDRVVDTPGEPPEIGARAVVRAHGIRRTFGRGEQAVTALDSVDLTLHEGELTVVTGPSGSGKSTLLHVLSGLDRPDEGEVFLGDQQLSLLNPHELALVRRRRIGFVLQFFNLVPTLSTLENVAFPLLLDREPDALEQAAQRLLDVGLSPEVHGRRMPDELSGGQQQRVALARALVAKPDAVFADEPTGNLDSATGEEVLTLLRQIADQGHTVLLVTHDERAVALGDRALHLRDGRLVGAGRDA